LGHAFLAAMYRGRLPFGQVDLENDLQSAERVGRRSFFFNAQEYDFDVTIYEIYIFKN